MIVKSDMVDLKPDTPLIDRIFQSVVGRIIIAVLQTFLSSLVLLLVFRFRVQVDVTLLKFTLVLLVGMLAGFSARTLLKSHTRILEMLAALFSAVLSLGVLHSISSGFLGINLFARTAGGPDWASLFQFGIAALGALLVVNAFRSRRQVDESSARVSSSQPKRKLPGLSAINLAALRRFPKRLYEEVLKKTTAEAVTKINSRESARSEDNPKRITVPGPPEKLSLAPRSIRKKIQPSGRLKQRSPKEIKFIGKQEHICPYCLEPVKEHDPRGIKICPICKTRHHADCWGITGSCQVPHYHQ